VAWWPRQPDATRLWVNSLSDTENHH
jgi:hypothetical protein